MIRSLMVPNGKTVRLKKLESSDCPLPPPCPLDIKNVQVFRFDGPPPSTFICKRSLQQTFFLPKIVEHVWESCHLLRLKKSLWQSGRNNSSCRKRLKLGVVQSAKLILAVEKVSIIKRNPIYC